MIGKKCGFVLLALGILTIIVGVVIEVVPEQMMPDLLRSNLAIVPTSKTFEPWSNPGKLPVTMEFRFFNIKNNLDTKSSGESTDTPVEEGGTPVVEEIGPYVYRETRVRSNVTFNDEQTELTFSEKTKFEFDAKASAGSEVYVANTMQNVFHETSLIIFSLIYSTNIMFVHAYARKSPFPLFPFHLHLG